MITIIKLFFRILDFGNGKRRQMDRQIDRQTNREKKCWEDEVKQIQLAVDKYI